MTSSVMLGIADFGNEKSKFGFNVPTITAANHDQALLDILAVQSAIDDVVLEPTSRKVVSIVDTPYGPRSTVNAAQRETKWRVRFTDNVSAIGNGSFEIPCADLSLLVAGTGVMNTDSGLGAALLAAIESFVVSRLGNAITVSEIVHVGRNL